MTLDDGTTDGQADSHTAALRRVERVEDSLKALWVDAHSDILYAQARAIVAVDFSRDHEVPRAILDAAHRVRGVQQQVQDDLLELDAIACDRWEAIGKPRTQNHAASLKLAR